MNLFIRSLAIQHDIQDKNRKQKLKKYQQKHDIQEENRKQKLKKKKTKQKLKEPKGKETNHGGRLVFLS